MSFSRDPCASRVSHSSRATGLSSRRGLRPVSPSTVARPCLTCWLERRVARTRNNASHGLVALCSSGSHQASEAEEAANKKRWQESGGAIGSADQWRWSLNWDVIAPQITVGSCPRSPADIDRMVDEADIDAIICLQSEACFEAMQIEWPAIRQQAIKRGVAMTRVAVRDFDHNDQALMLPEAVRLLHTLTAMGKRVYVHCTAGINRATLTVVGYLTFIQGMQLEAALKHVKEKRPQAHPYVDCWKRVRARLLEDRRDEVKARAQGIYLDRKSRGNKGKVDGFADWLEAEAEVIKSTFERQTGCTATLLDSLQDLAEQHLATAGEEQSGKVSDLEAELQQERQAHQQAQEEIDRLKQKPQRRVRRKVPAAAAVEQEASPSFQRPAMAALAESS